MFARLKDVPSKRRCMAEKNADNEVWEEWRRQESDVGGDQGGGG